MRDNEANSKRFLTNGDSNLGCRYLKLPRIMLAAPSSGSGKTMITCGILEVLRQNWENQRSQEESEASGGTLGLQPIAFKCGPDYIDPMFHRFVLGVGSRNLDTFFTDKNTTCGLMAKGAKTDGTDDTEKLAVVEGVMGFYDGLGGVSVRGSSFELADWTKTPVVLIVDGKGMSLSMVALIRGFLEMYWEKNNDSETNDSWIRGVILNRVSKAVYERLKPVIENELPITVLGYVPEVETIRLPNRHLGLVTPDELPKLKEQIKKFAEILRETLDWEGILSLALGAEPLKYECEFKQDFSKESSRIRIGVPKDAAFCFYYEENLALLRECGAEIVYFSPMTDQCLPNGLDGLYMGGGYPELYAEKLSGNVSMRRDLHKALEAGMPCLAECGAFMYLHQVMLDSNGREWPMVGAIEGKVENKGRLVRFGYAEMIATKDTILGSSGLRLPVHEFHYWDTTVEGGCFCAKKPMSESSRNCMYQDKNLLAGFPHLYFYANPGVAENFVSVCRKWHKSC